MVVDQGFAIPTNKKTTADISPSRYDGGRIHVFFRFICRFLNFFGTLRFSTIFKRIHGHALGGVGGSDME